LQDKLNKPHVRNVTYDAKTDSYIWLGTNSGKKMSMKRSQFEAEVWSDYYKNQKIIGGL
jgi:hypothetical protein